MSKNERLVQAGVYMCVGMSVHVEDIYEPANDTRWMDGDAEKLGEFCQSAGDSPGSLRTLVRSYVGDCGVGAEPNVWNAFCDSRCRMEFPKRKGEERVIAKGSRSGSGGCAFGELAPDFA